MGAPIVFFDLAGPDAKALGRFYASVFGWDVGEGGGFAVQVNAPLHATIRQDPAEKVLYVGVPDIAATLDAITAQGGEVIAPRFEVPGVVVLGLFNDPAGNRMGLVEMDGARAKIP